MQALLNREASDTVRSHKRTQSVWRAGADLIVRLHEPQFGLGFTAAILLMNVDYSSI
jgi:hypothetical protein